MTIDALLLFDPSGTSITTSAASTNVLDLGTPRDLGIGDPKPKIEIVIQQTFTAAGAATLNVQVQSSVDNVTWSTLAESSPIAVANLTQGRQLLRIDLPADQPAQTAGIGRYLRLNYVVATGPFTAGQVLSALVLDRPSTPTYASGFNAAN
jgi:hypothetical protein